MPTYQYRCEECGKAFERTPAATQASGLTQRVPLVARNSPIYLRFDDGTGCLAWRSTPNAPSFFGWRNEHG